MQTTVAYTRKIQNSARAAMHTVGKCYYLMSSVWRC